MWKMAQAEKLEVLTKPNTFAVTEPSSANILGHVTDCDVADFQRAIESAHSAQAEFYRSTTGPARGALLRKWYDLIIANKKDLATILCLENGKPYAEAMGEIIFAASFVAWFSEEAPRVYGFTIPSQHPDSQLWAVKEPVGVCGIITPWNFPAAMITRKIAPALAVGCTVVIKPPSETPFTCLALTKLALDAGFPPTTIQVCPTKDRQAATELATNPLIRKISFTGSTAVGKMLAKLASGTLKKVSLELGGNAPFTVFDDADIDAAVDGAMFSKFRCSGQTCICSNRFIVQSGVVEEFTKKFAAKVASLKMGPGLDASTTQGPLVNKATVQKVAEYLQNAVEKGAKIEVGGLPNNSSGYFFSPTVLTGVEQGIIDIYVLQLANNTEFGLASYFFSKDISRVMRVASRIQSGMIGVNTGKISACEAPFGGVKENGYGREGSHYGIDEYLTIKAITLGNLS
ncbi:Aldehyde/histidinol dehydrogenase [Xylogone sp. PMI_703]|nr:Aldehyde/histidinol dehydrogenase [Xylogone sp. PMI_703]